MSKPIQVRIQIYDSEYKSDPPENLFEYIEWLEDMVNSIPKEHRGTAKIETDVDGDYIDNSAYSFTTINYWRDETVEEMNDRLIQETIRNRKLDDKERREYERLKAKYD